MKVRPYLCLRAHLHAAHPERLSRVQEAFKFNLIETSLCLTIATIVNITMLILAAAQFYPERVVSMEQGADLLQRTLGSSARMLFAIAMLCAGQSSSLTGYVLARFHLR